MHVEMRDHTPPRNISVDFCGEFSRLYFFLLQGVALGGGLNYFESLELKSGKMYTYTPLQKFIFPGIL